MFCRNQIPDWNRYLHFLVLGESRQPCLLHLFWDVTGPALCTGPASSRPWWVCSTKPPLSTVTCLSASGERKGGEGCFLNCWRCISGIWGHLCFSPCGCCVARSLSAPDPLDMLPKGAILRLLAFVWKMQSAQTPELPCLCFYPKFVVQTLKINLARW